MRQSTLFLLACFVWLMALEIEAQAPSTENLLHAPDRTYDLLNVAVERRGEKVNRVYNYLLAIEHTTKCLSFYLTPQNQIADCRILISPIFSWAGTLLISKSNRFGNSMASSWRRIQECGVGSAL
jgi:hypothetical protein